MSESNGFLSFPEKNRFEIVLSFLFLLGVVVCVLFISIGNLSGKEGGILSLFLTVLSIIASWLLAKVYGDSQHAKAIEDVKEMHNEKVRTFALKAAEKVNNLSEQINRLSIYLEDELNNDSYENDRLSLIAKEERMESAIHILSMLKSVNDTSLSDWHGVIDEVIEEQREAREEREEELRELIYKLESLIVKANRNAEDERLSKQIEVMKKDMRLLMAGVSGAHVTPSKISKRNIRRDVNKSCPSCGEALKYTQRAKSNSDKTIYCKSCSSLVHSRFSSEKDDFLLVVKGEKREELNCPQCESKVIFELDSESNSKKVIKCGQCHNEIRVSRVFDGKIKYGAESGVITASGLTEEDIQKVRAELPVQPWPKGIHKIISEKLGMSNAAVMKATRELIKRGVFKEQIDGVLYDLVKDTGVENRSIN